MQNRIFTFLSGYSGLKSDGVHYISCVRNASRLAKNNLSLRVRCTITYSKLYKSNKITKTYLDSLDFLLQHVLHASFH